VAGRVLFGDAMPLWQELLTLAMVLFLLWLMSGDGKE